MSQTGATTRRARILPQVVRFRKSDAYRESGGAALSRAEPYPHREREKRLRDAL